MLELETGSAVLLRSPRKIGIGYQLTKGITRIELSFIS